MGWKGLERNKLDYILTDLLPVELSELFSFRPFYDFLMQKSQNKELFKLAEDLKSIYVKATEVMFEGAWATVPYKYSILKGNDSLREMSIIQPLSALNVFLFMECYQNDILNYLDSNNCFSIRYHRKSNDLYYKSRSMKAVQYFSLDIRRRIGKAAVQQTGNYFNISRFESINSFADSRIWRMANFEYKYYAQMDYKSCFDSIYTHVYKWIIERNVIDSKRAKNANLFITIDRVLQNINGRQSNGLIVGPEFSRMIAEVILQQIDTKVKLLLSREGLDQGHNYKVFRYVDDIFVFADSQDSIDKIIETFQTVGNRYLLHLNELKMVKGLTPPLPKRWLEKTRILADKLDGLFVKISKHEYIMLPDKDKHIVKSDYSPVDRIKDEFITLMNDYQENRRTIVSFLLSVLLNNVSKVKDGYRLFANEKSNKALLLIDLSFFMFAFSPTFDSTRKLISMISYMNNEVCFIKQNSKENDKLENVIRRYSFIFKCGNLPDITDWFPFFAEYHITLDTNTELEIVRKAEANNNPITWANILLYSKYYKPFYDSMKAKVEMIVDKEISKLSSTEFMMQTEFWYILIFHNCPYLSSNTLSKINNIISSICTQANNQMSNQNTLYVGRATTLLCDFLCRHSPGGNKPLESFYDWNENRSISQQITYRTFQRTLFKKYKTTRNNLYASIE